MKQFAGFFRKAFAIVALSSFSVGYAQTGPTPVAIFAKDGIRVNSYDFNSFEPYLKQSSDTIYVVNFWATWCAPCIVELPHFEKLGQAYKGKNVKVLLVSLDSKKNVEKSLIPFIRKKKLQSDCVLLSDPDMNAWIPKVDPEWSGALPATLIYNGSTGQRKFYEQSFTYEQLETEVKSFIK